MTVKTTYGCECCGKEWDSNDKTEQICAIAISVSFNNTTITSTFNRVKTSVQQWCRTCVMKKGIEDPATMKDKEVSPEIPPTFEEKVIELLDSLGYNRD